MAAGVVWRTVRRGLTAVGAVTVLGTASSVYAVRTAKAEAAKLPSEFILDLDFEDIELVEKGLARPLVPKIGRVPKPMALKQVVDALHAAGTDERVKGVIAHIGSTQNFSGLAQIQELRDAVTEFRQKAAGRAATVAYADAFGEAGGFGTMSYYLASGFEKIYLQPSGLVSISGIASATPFLKGFFDRWHVQPQFVTREEYKNVINQFTQDGYTKQHREATEALLKCFVDEMVEGIASSRGLDKRAARRAIDDAPFTCDEALQRRLIDEARYRDEVDDAFTNSNGGKLRRIPVSRYLKMQAAARGEKPGSDMMMAVKLLRKGEDADLTELAAQGSAEDTPAVALIMACGQIVSGKGSATELQPMREVASTPMCAQLRAARLDPQVRAVVLRVDSPGGSAIASDTIYREVLRVKQAGKPVIVSMGNVAASGGYYISAPATRIVAQPTTVTGSIGVVFGKFNIAGALRDQGVNACSIVEGRNADAQFPFAAYSRQQLRLVNHLVDHIYTGFIQKVAAGRGLSEAQVRKLAKGRVWTGKDALAHGLVDALGGLQHAIDMAKQEAGLPLEEDAVVIKEMGRPLPVIVKLVKLLQGGDASLAAVVAEGSLLPAHLQQLLLSAAGAPVALGCSSKAAELPSLLASGPQMIAPGFPVC